jgi:hypothetical protein
MEQQNQATTPGDKLKFDDGKLRWDLLDFSHVEDIVRVLTMGAEKYVDNGWKTVPNAQERYFAAMMRHLVAWRLEGPLDGESHLPHLAHAACCLMILHWHEETDSGKHDG